ncbi:serine proteinase stubble isoform X6 [Cimex lectularius]|uniref:Peptidase S1 domain-containing protein n=1 Tax=Cimex lectularius TaxID=79782 RepID=A0A8I6S8M6_CIMLE|nr:serine proteinase stubble isoform X6 [Cimex lectularius]
MVSLVSWLGLWCLLSVGVGCSGDNSTEVGITISSDNFTTVAPATTDIPIDLEPTSYGKPSKFDENIEDKIYVDQKDVMDKLMLEQKGVLFATDPPEPVKNEILKRRRRATATVWQVRRYVRFPGPQRPPWELARSPRLVFREHEPSLQAPWSHNSLIEETNIQGCGLSVKNQAAQRRIVGGDEAGFGSFPWQAYIRIGSSRCGGSLVNRYHVVTAGHCVARANARQVQVTLGDYVINSAVEPLPAYTYGVRQISVHPYFKFTPQADRFDVAVLRLDRPVQYMPHIAPICLPTKGEDFLGQYGWAAGWGALQPGSRLRPKTLQAVDVPVIDNRLCERWHRSNGINVVIYDEMMCAGYRGGGKDSCQGDSGGPLMLERSGRWFLIGIVSAGYSCAQRGQPGIYHRVANTVDWISHIINS